MEVAGLGRNIDVGTRYEYVRIWAGKSPSNPEQGKARTRSLQSP